MQTPSPTFLRLPAVTALTGLARSTIYKFIQTQNFPEPVKLGRASAWPADAVHTWCRSRINPQPS